MDAKLRAFYVRQMTETARSWLKEHAAADAQWWGGRHGFKALVVEPRYVQDIVNGAREAGLEVR